MFCYFNAGYTRRAITRSVPLTQPYAVCDTDQNGLHEFDLTTLDAQILGANPTGNTITYHYTQTDAQLGIYAIANPSAFTITLPITKPYG